MKGKNKSAAVLALLLGVGLFAGCGAKEEAAAPEAVEEQPAEVLAEESETVEVSYMDKLIEAAQEEGALVVYGSCEEEYLAAACEQFEKLYGIEVQFSVCPPARFRARLRRRKGIPPLTYGLAERQTPIMCVRPKACWKHMTRRMPFTWSVMSAAMLMVIGMAFTKDFLAL